jgi:complement component 1 Q subcomponent-binding protein
LKESFGEFVEKRGVNADLLEFIEKYSEWKEQREYVQWLSNMKEFVSAK